MRTFCFLILIIFISTILRADEIRIPFSVYPKKLQALLLEKGYKLDLSSNDREEDSWGFLDNRGSDYSIFTYRQIDVKKLDEIQKIVMESQNE